MAGRRAIFLCSAGFGGSGFKTGLPAEALDCILLDGVVTAVKMGSRISSASG